MAWSQQLNNTEVNILKNAGNQLFLTKEGQILLATINKRDAEIKNEIYENVLTVINKYKLNTIQSTYILDKLTEIEDIINLK